MGQTGSTDGPMRQMLVDDDLAGEQIAMPLAKAFEFRTLADQLHAHRQVGIGDLEAVLPQGAMIAIAIMGMLTSASMATSSKRVRSMMPSFEKLWIGQPVLNYKAETR